VTPLRAEETALRRERTQGGLKCISGIVTGNIPSRCHLRVSRYDGTTERRLIKRSTDAGIPGARERGSDRSGGGVEEDDRYRCECNRIGSLMNALGQRDRVSVTETRANDASLIDTGAEKRRKAGGAVGSSSFFSFAFPLSPFFSLLVCPPPPAILIHRAGIKSGGNGG